MTANKSGIADVEQIKRWSPVWIVPIVTVLIGAWILFYHFTHQGPEVTLTTVSAEGITAGKTTIKSRSVNVGIVESVVLSNDLNQVIIKARLNTGMEKLLKKDSVFWIVKPQIDREGISGLGTLLSGAYIELQPGKTGHELEQYSLLTSPPLAPPDAKGLRIVLESNKAGQLSAGEPVLFHSYRVGSVETGNFDPKTRMMRYQLFINAPYDSLVTENARFWKDSGLSLDLSSQGVRLEMGSLTTLLAGGVSFDVPDGWPRGELAKQHAEYRLFDDQASIQNSLYTHYKDYLLFFSDSVRGLQKGAPVEFRGIRLGTVQDVPYYNPDISQALEDGYRIPVLVRIEPERFERDLGKDFNFEQHLLDGENKGLRASLKPGNLITGALYVDLNFYPDAKKWSGPKNLAGYPVLPTVSSGLAQIQQKLMATLDKINALPLNPMLEQATKTLAESQSVMAQTKKTMSSLNTLLNSKEVQALPKETQQSLIELNRTLKGLQPGSPAYNKMLDDMQRLDQVLRDMQPILRTLNDKSNALVFDAPNVKDPQPKKAKQ